MARGVAIGEYQPRVPASEGMRRIIPERSPASIGSALEDLGESVAKIQQSEAAQFSLQALSKAQSDWTQRLNDMQEKAEPGAPGFTPAVMKEYGDYVNKVTKGAPTPLAGKFLSQHLAEFGVQLQKNALNFEANARQAHNENTATESIDAAGNELMQNPGVYPQRLAEREALISAMNLDPQVKEKLNTYAKTSMAKFAALGDINRDPYSAMQSLQSPTGYYSHLPPAERVQLMQHADMVLHQRVADAERLETLQKRQQEEIADGILRDGILKSQSGQLSADWITKRASLLKPQELKFLFSELSGKDVQSDLHVYSDLLGRAGHGDDVSTEAQDALFKGQLSKEDYTRIANMGANKEGWFQRGTQYLTTMSGYSELNPNIDSAGRKARMLDEWHDWAVEHPKATDKEAQAAYQDIATHTAIVKISSLPYMKYAQGSPLSPDIAATKKATADAYQRGELSKEDFGRQAQIIQEWQRALEMQHGPDKTQ